MTTFDRVQIAKRRAKEQKARSAEREARASFDSEKQGKEGKEGEEGEEGEEGKNEEIEASKEDNAVNKSKISVLGGKGTDDSDVPTPKATPKAPSQAQADAAWAEKKRFEATEGRRMSAAGKMFGGEGAKSVERVKQKESEKVFIDADTTPMEEREDRGWVESWKMGESIWDKDIDAQVSSKDRYQIPQTHTHATNTATRP